MNNSFESEIDKAFIQKRETVFNELTNEFSLRLENAADREFVKSKIVNELSERKRRLYSSTLLVNEINNIYKHDTILRFNEILREERINPVEKMFSKVVPELREYHRNNTKKTEFSYSFDSSFLEADEDQILILLAQSSAIDDYIQFLYQLALGNLSTKKENKDSSKSHPPLPIILQPFKASVDQVIQILHKNLHDKGFEISYNEFQSHFSGSPFPSSKIKWLLSERLLVYLFIKLQKAQLIQGSFYESIVDHFVNKNGQAFDVRQLGITYQQIGNSPIRDQELVDDLILEINSLG